MNTITHRDQSRGMTSLQDQVNRLFAGNFTPDRSGHDDLATWAPPVDIYEGRRFGPVLTTKEVDMFARSVSMHLKPNNTAEFTRTIENEIIPLLRKQKGFQDEITLVAAEGLTAIAISFWDRKENAEAYSRTTYPEVQKALAKVVEGTPQVRTHEVSNSTFHQIAARVAA